VLCLAASPDIDLLASGGADGLLLLHSLETGALLRALQPQPGAGAAALVAVAAAPALVLVHHWGDLSLRAYDVNGRQLAAADAGERLHVGGGAAPGRAWPAVLRAAPACGSAPCCAAALAPAQSRPHARTTTRLLAPPPQAMVVTADRRQLLTAGDRGMPACAGLPAWRWRTAGRSSRRQAAEAAAAAAGSRRPSRRWRWRRTRAASRRVPRAAAACCTAAAAREGRCGAQAAAAGAAAAAGWGRRAAGRSTWRIWARWCELVRGLAAACAGAACAAADVDSARRSLGLWIL
jgi:hypothetical protein